jgi:hypothetical protein
MPNPGMNQLIKEFSACDDKMDTIIKQLKQAISLTCDIQVAIRDRVPPNTGFRETLNQVGRTLNRVIDRIERAREKGYE